MARPRTPLAKARITGQAAKRRARFEGRREVGSTEELGDPPAWMSPDQRIAWGIFRAELPWLNRSHRGLVEIASHLRARLMGGGEFGVQAMQLLRLCLANLGATPVDASKVGATSDADDDDPSAEYFN